MAPTYMKQETKGQTMNTCSDADRSEDVGGGDTWCPLFMEGLPKDFTKNTGLAALASLLEEDDSSKDNSKSDRSPPQPSVGGGKLRKGSRNRSTSRHQPYRKKSSKENRASSMGEAQLFLSMWKI
eukprot:CAMPEP_0185732238 /NCGR_PEP_ID=MMETSP1171-20130828/15484_1 /TAXON_ID=374046 /ORGANISM="Helicotheca tamensis, Strain CCMP826" /LENGTH=124 /DNA_ID=CAMNT_0028401681 /DNA_START=153 /DNA_END=527 /DNA_ORIENTATION=+